MQINTKDFQVPEGSSINLSEWATHVDPLYKSKKEYKATLKEHVKTLAEEQGKLYSDNRHALLLIFQAMDAAGKDGAIKHVMSGINPQGCQVSSFKQPSIEELDHDFLWRTTCRLPQRGCIGIFNRSYYEEVLIVQVHPELLQYQKLPDECINRPDFWQGRYASIRDFEAHLYRNGTRVVKFFLHVSKEEQRKRFLSRIDEPEKNWKFSHADIEERQHWDAYQEAYADCMAATSTADSSWYVIPADDKRNARLIISWILQQQIHPLQLGYPETSEERRAELAAIRHELA